MTRPISPLIQLSALSLFMLPGASSIAQEFPTAELSPGSILIDGALDAAWDAVEAHPLNVDIDGTSPEASNFSGYWKGLWDEDALYLLFTTVDDLTVPYPGSQFFRFDVTELFIDPNDSSGTSYDGVDDSQFVWPRDGQEMFAHTNANPLGISLPIPTDLIATEGMVSIEVKIAWADLQLVAAPGLSFGFDVYMKDNDTGFAIRDHQLSWSPSQDLAWRNPSLLGTVVLTSGQSGDWFGYEIVNNSFADTGDWLGWVEITHSPWVYVYSLERYLFLSEESPGWAFVPRWVSGN